MVGRPCADPEQKQDFGDRTVTQGIDTQRPITEALLWQVRGTGEPHRLFSLKDFAREVVMSTSVAWEHELQSWLEPFLTHLHHPARRRMCPLYVAGLIGPVSAKACSPWRLGLRLSATTSCITSWLWGPWDEAPLESELLARPTGLSAGLTLSW
jgi:hypothetical protein